MAYKNFLFRLFFSFIFIITYLIISYIDFYYVFYLILLVYFFVFLEILFYFKKYKIIPIIYLIFSFIFFINIDFKNINILNFNLFIFIIITFDIFSYLTGISFGKHKLINISPNKTIEGLVGGIIFSIILSYLFINYFNLSFSNQFSYIILIIFTAFIGDIVESYFKRKNNLKNSSELIPGHGGVFDRFDSFLFSIIIYSISNLF